MKSFSISPPLRVLLLASYFVLLAPTTAFVPQQGPALGGRTGNTVGSISSNALLWKSSSVAVAPSATTTTTTTRSSNHHHHHNNNNNYKRHSSQSLTTLRSNHDDSSSSSSLERSIADKNGDGKISFWERISMALSTVAASKIAKKYGVDFNASSEAGLNALTLVRVGLPAALVGFLSFLAFPAMSLGLASVMTQNAGTLTVLSTDSSQFVQNFLTVAGLLFSILVGQTYYFMYQQQEMVYYALFNEVTEAKSLLEQVALVCQGRSMYPKVLGSIQKYVTQDLKKLQADPAVLLSARPMDDPLETIMYLTSVGVPSTVYETVKSLRQARAQRLGALQRKLPQVHMLLLWFLAALELSSFPLLGAGTQTIGGYNILTIEGCLFGVMTTGIVMTLRVVGELWRPAGGAYNVDNVLKIMVRGLEDELQARLDGKKISTMAGVYPSGTSSSSSSSGTAAAAAATTTIDAEFMKQADRSITSANAQVPVCMDEKEHEIMVNQNIQQQGADISIPIRRVIQWVKSRRRRRHQQ